MAEAGSKWASPGCDRPPSRLRHLRLVEGASVAILLALGWLDYATGYEFGFFIFYFIPVSITTWYAGRWSGLAMALASALAWFLSDLLAHHPYSKGYFLYWETFMRLASFLTTALTLAKIRESVAAERRLNEELCRALEENRRMRCALGEQAPAVAAGEPRPPAPNPPPGP
jgi:K+-sensing histidine kinase KdpD